MTTRSLELRSRPPSGSADDDSAIDRDRRAVHKRTRPAAQEQARPGDILRRANAAQRHARPDDLPEAPQRLRHHLALKRPARQRVARDAPRAEVARQHPAQVVQARLARRVGKRLERGHLEAVDGADVDDARRVERAGVGAGLEERRQELGDCEDALEVERQDAVPGRVGVLVVRRAPGGARVVDQDVELCDSG